MTTPRRSATLAALFAGDVVVFTLDEGDPPPALHPEEVSAVARAVPGRRAEFARGRACARAAISALGLGRPAIPVGDARAPVWPEGVTGSITHCRGLVAAAVGRVPGIRSLGLDAEPRGALDADVAHRIAAADELARAAAGTGLPPDDAPRLVFSAKEVVHKCIHPLSGVVLDFLDVAIVFDGGAGAFAVEARSERARALAPLMMLRGRYRVDEAHVVTAGWVPGAP